MVIIADASKILEVFLAQKRLCTLKVQALLLAHRLLEALLGAQCRAPVIEDHQDHSIYSG